MSGPLCDVIACCNCLCALLNLAQLGAWAVFAVVLSRLRFFYGVMLGTFVLSYMGNTAINVSMKKGNKALERYRMYS